MKKIALVLSLAFLVFSCSDDDEGSSVSTSDLVGTWTLASIVEDGESEDLDSCELQSKYVFTDSDLTDEEFYESSSSVYNEETEEFEIVEGCDSYSDTYPYLIKNGNELYTTYEYEGKMEEDYEGKISISGDNLIITFEATVGSQSYKEVITYIKS